MRALDPHELVRAQLATDEARCASYPGLFAHKVARMSASPFAFLRGAAPLFYAALRQRPDLARGPSGTGWIAGDLHLENFGAYRPTSIPEEQKRARRHDAAFDLNDFDDAAVGPWRWDVLRLTTSLLLAGRELRARGPRVLELADALLEAHAEHACHEARLPAPPAPVAELLDRVRSRSRDALLAARIEVVHRKRVFVRGPRYRDVPKRLAKEARAAFARYAERLAEEEKIDPKALEILDVAFRVAGTGSLGALRLAVLTRGARGEWIFDMKEQGSPSAAVLLERARLKAAKRVLTAMEASVARPPRMLGTARLEGRSMFVRRLSPQDDKLDLTRVLPEDLAPLARYLGALAGAAHRRGAKKPPRRAWTKEERRGLVDRAVVLAGFHEAAYLVLCRAVKRVK